MKRTLTAAEVVNRMRTLLYSDPVYVWGANGEVITPELIDSLKNRYISERHTPDYYDEKLNVFRGRKAVDDIGMLNYLSGENLSLGEYLAESTDVFPGVDISGNHVRVLYRVNQSGRFNIGIYLGNNSCITMTEYDGMNEAVVVANEWDGSFLPPFMPTDSAIDPEKGHVSNIVAQYQMWLNTRAAERGLGGISISGYYDAQTITLSRLIAKLIYGDLIGTTFDPTPKITQQEIASNIDFNAAMIQNHSILQHEYLLYIISMRLYKLNIFPEFVSLWGSTEVVFGDNFATKQNTVRHGLQTFMIHNRYLDSSIITLHLLKELF